MSGDGMTVSSNPAPQFPAVVLRRGKIALQEIAPGIRDWDGVTIDAYLDEAIAYVGPTRDKRIVFPDGTLRVKQSHNLPSRGYQLEGVRDGRPTQGGGSRLLFGPASLANPVGLLTIGVSGIAGDPWYDPSYSNNPGGMGNYAGQQETYFRNLSFAYDTALALTALLINPTIGFGENTAAIRDYYGGTLRLRNVTFERFKYALWAMQSDFDSLYDVTALYCQTALYFGPRSDQLRTFQVEVNGCDTGLDLDRCNNSTHSGLDVIDCGTATQGGVRVRSQYADAYASGHTFVAPWFENGAGGADGTIDVQSFLEVGGPNDANISRRVTVINPQWTENPSGGGQPRAKYAFQMGRGDKLEIYGLGDLSNFDKGFVFTSQQNNFSQVKVHGFGDDETKLTYDNLSPGAVQQPSVVSFDAAYGIANITTANGRVAVQYNQQASNYANNYRIGSESQFGFFVSFPNRGGVGGANNLVGFTRVVQHGAAAPTTGTWQQGDRVINNAPAVGQPKSWVCTVPGTPGTWVSEGNL